MTQVCRKVLEDEGVLGDVQLSEVCCCLYVDREEAESILSLDLNSSPCRRICCRWSWKTWRGISLWFVHGPTQLS